MASEELLKELFRYHTDYRKCNVEFTESWKHKISQAIEYRCKERNIKEDEVLFQLFEDEVMEEYSSIIRNETLKRYANFYDIKWEVSGET
jgi:hypothetical protein